MIRSLLRLPSPERTGVIMLAALLTVDVLLSLLFLWGLGNAAAPSLMFVPAPHFFAFLYGYYRVAALHPAWHEPYRQWLRTSPWIPGKPLPLGSPLPRWSDLLFLAAALLFGAAHLPAMVDELRYTAYLPAIPALFLLPYAAVSALIGLMTRQRRLGYTILALLALVIPVIKSATAILAVEALACLLAVVALRRSLTTFPWEGARYIFLADIMRADITALFGVKEQQAYGWPWAVLAPGIPVRSMPREDGWLLSLLLGWIFYAATFHIPPDENGHLVLYVGIVGLLPLARLAIYWAGYRPPISLLGRLATGRLIVPSYDRMLVPAMVAWALGTALPRWLLSVGIPFPVALSVGVAAVTAVVLNAGPTLADWRLTGGWNLSRLRLAQPQSRRPVPPTR